MRLNKLIIRKLRLIILIKLIMEGLLPDPNKDRMVNSVVPPPQHPINHSILFPASMKRGSQEIPDWLALKDHLLKEGRMYKIDLIQLIRDVTELMSKDLFIKQYLKYILNQKDLFTSFLI